MGGNAVVGYKQSFDLETESHVITARAFGTAVRLSLPDASPRVATILTSPTSMLNMTEPSSPTKQISAIFCDIEPISPVSSNERFPSHSRPQSADVSLLTIDSFPNHCLRSIGGFVSAASVKILDTDNRASYWSELRDEIKAHAKVLGCSVIIGYSEQISIQDDVAVLSAAGTAALVDLRLFANKKTESPLSDPEFDYFSRLGKNSEPASAVESAPLKLDISSVPGSAKAKTFEKNSSILLPKKIKKSCRG